MKPDIEIGNFVIRLPDENNRQFYIFHDLAELFGKEFQSDAVSALKKAIKLEEGLKPKPSIDYEADNASVRTSSAQTIFKVSRIIETLTIPEYKAGLNENKWTEVLESLKLWKRPKPKKWNIGDVFSIQLSDGSYAFGQALTKPEKSWMSPSFALFGLKSETESIELDLLKNSNPITILHLLDMNLKNGKWKVIGNLETPLCDPYSGPWGKNLKSGSPGILESVANYYWFKTHDYKDESQLTELVMKKGNWLNKIKKYWS